MPYKSQVQRRFMYAKHPKLAKEFEEKTPKGADLPEHAPKRDALRRLRRRKKDDKY